MNLLRQPDVVRAFDAHGHLPLEMIDVTCTAIGSGAGAALRVEVAAEAPLSRVLLRWHEDLSAVVAYLPDAWERSYGELSWRPEQPEAVLPWSFLAKVPDGVLGAGVRINPGALCFWTADSSGVSLWADVRCGGAPVHLAGRRLHIADVVTVRTDDHDTAFTAQRQLNAAMAAGDVAARRPDHPVYGSNDWHYSLGESDRRSILSLAAFTAAAAGERANRPYVMVDDGWSSGGLGQGPWIGNGRYGHMGTLARDLRDAGVRPGLWYRPLTPLPEHRDRYRLARNGGAVDPSIPAVRDSIAEQLQRFASWGYELIKHDFTVWDALGRWGFQMGGQITDDGWSFADTARTTAEVFVDLNQLIHAAAGASDGATMVMGCNAFGHLIAGHAELQRIGDDASGRSWNRTRRMAVNALAFRAAQHDALYAIDADAAVLTPQIPWKPGVQWLHLLAASGTPTFVSVAPESRRAALAAVTDAFTMAASAQALAEPLDWEATTTPRRWRLGEHTITYDWIEPDGPWPIPD